MPISYDIDPARRLVIARGHGVLTHDEIIDYQTTVWSRADVQGFHEIVDVLAVEHFDYRSSRDVRSIAVLAAEMDTDTPSRFAIVASEEVAYGLARMYMSYREVQPGVKKEMGIFATLEEAEAWVGAGQPADPIS